MIKFKEKILVKFFSIFRFYVKNYVEYLFIEGSVRDKRRGIRKRSLCNVYY